VRKYIEKTFTPYIEDVKENFVKYNAKELLQEYTQSLTKNTPIYRVIKESGPAHKKVFEVEVSYNGEILATETGSTKKDAEQKAAYNACIKLGIK
jgi:ribonuclease-3